MRNQTLQIWNKDGNKIYRLEEPCSSYIYIYIYIHPKVQQYKNTIISNLAPTRGENDMYRTYLYKKPLIPLKLSDFESFYPFLRTYICI